MEYKIQKILYAKQLTSSKTIVTGPKGFSLTIAFDFDRFTWLYKKYDTDYQMSCP